jgi:hypothetical protein
VLLKKVSDLSRFLQGSNYPTFHLSISSFNILFNIIEDFNEENFVKKAWSKLKKYYTITDLSPYHVISTILSPSLKLKYFIENEFSEEEISNIIFKFRKIFNEYNDNNIIEPIRKLPKDDNYLTIFNLSNDQHGDEIESYLKENIIPLHTKDSILIYWEERKHEFPILYKMAMDILAIPISSAPVEREFSLAKLVCLPNRNRLKAETIKKLVLLKSWNKIKFSQ